jgi:SAM-dependent methyltransferase
MSAANQQPEQQQPEQQREQQEQEQQLMTATYDPADNKLRMRAVSRLPKELYLRVKAAGFAWAPKQELFVAPAWSPEREDLALELCGEIDDEDTSLVERAEERAERFADYQEKRTDDAERAHNAVTAIADNIPLGQPILVGHHSEKHARKDAERIQNGMRRAIKLWETSKYWEARAKGALRHAKYKELPGVRHRRIKGLEADLRKREKQQANSRHFLSLWQYNANITVERALSIANYDHLYIPGSDFKSVWFALDRSELTAEEARKIGIESNDRIIAYCDRWIAHLTNRLAYERAMLDEGGGIAVTREGFDVRPGGQVLGRHGWAIVLRVNKAHGEVNSYTVAGRWGKMKIGIEEVKDYRPPSDEDAAKVQAATKLSPLVNYPGEGFRSFTKAEWTKYEKTDISRPHRIAATEKYGAHRLRMFPSAGYKHVGVYITDAPRKDPPAPSSASTRELPERLPTEPTEQRKTTCRPSFATWDENLARMEASLKAGVQVVSADQLFPTPPELCKRMVALAGVGEGDKVLEPSAGTGNIVQAIRARGGRVVAIEIHPRIAVMVGAHCADFLSVEPGALIAPRLGEEDQRDPEPMPSAFDAVIMNPPFKDGADIKHILHAREFLKPGGRLVAICAGGPRQVDKLKPLCESWEELPEGTFDGTGVRAVLLTIRGPQKEART